MRLKGALPSPAEEANGYIVYRNIMDGADMVHRVVPEGTEDWVALQRPPRTPEIAYEISLGQGVAGLRLVGDALEFLDGAGTPRLRVSPPYLVDSTGQRHEVKLILQGCNADMSPTPPWGRPVTSPGASHCDLRLRWADDGVAYPVLIDPAWTTTGSMVQARLHHTATLLSTGKVLVTGGQNAVSTLSAAELYDPSTGTWASTGSMTETRTEHTATLLPGSGEVLVAGGTGPNHQLASAELYNPVTGTFTATASMNHTRVLHAATLVGTSVLVSGGSGTDAASSEMYVPALGVWVAQGSMATSRLLHAAVTLQDGRVLVTGGQYGFPTMFHSTAELFNPATGTWTAANFMNLARSGHTATVLTDGNVLVTGGSTGSNVLVSAELYRIANDSWQATDSMTSSERSAHTATLLQNGVVLVTGGFFQGTLASADIYSYQWGTGTWCATGTMNQARGFHTATLLPSGQVLVAGGLSSALSPPTSSTELYSPGTCDSCDDGSACTADSCNTTTGCCEHVNIDYCGNGVCGPEEAFCNCPSDCGSTDTDQDGLSDLWEISGVDVDCDNVADLDLASMGASPWHKDIFVEIDYMVAPNFAHNHIPQSEAISALTVAFANAPVTNPDNDYGINLHLSVSDALPHSFYLTASPATQGSSPDSVNIYDLRALHFDPARNKVFRYAVFGHSSSDPFYCPAGCAGLARPPNNLLMTLASPSNPTGTPEAQASVFMHEFGHCLGLQHGGDAGEPNYKPNYLSVMNYRYPLGIPTTVNGIPAAPRLDYSGQVLGTLNENALDETVGVLGAGPDLLTYYCPGESSATCSDCVACSCGNGACQPAECGEDEMNCPSDCPPCVTACGDGACQALCGETPTTCPSDCTVCSPGHCGNLVCEPDCFAYNAVASISGGIDWNCDGDTADTSVRANITRFGQSVFDVLTGFNDWLNIDYDFQCSPGFSAATGAAAEVTNDLNVEELTEKGFLLPLKSVSIDVVPHCAANPIVVGGPGLVSVIIASEFGFDATSIVSTSLVLANAGPLSTNAVDADGDGDLDLVAVFDMADLFLGSSSTQVTLYGSLPSSQPVYGQAPVTMVTSLGDSDGDGVVDPCDLCENTPAEAEVAEDGCQ
ncbi:kelch repeat-containing protein [Polyangium sorediatum]|uniref:Kelch repeat-containing protein n=1 Tax=Polyangium sorediatum TaxID=889274 RepID=A0ABT6P900_9BACT|nr:kelch repeat-containing protein [Polyangium sorediatum]MDI1437106.1 kelch repeat-containing protein [Polyangium sorediatum]